MQFSVIEDFYYFIQIKTEINNYDITAVSFNLDETLQSTGIGEIGGALLTTSREYWRRRNNYYL